MITRYKSAFLILGPRHMSKLLFPSWTSQWALASQPNDFPYRQHLAHKADFSTPILQMVICAHGGSPLILELPRCLSSSFKVCSGSRKLGFSGLLSFWSCQHGRSFVIIIYLNLYICILKSQNRTEERRQEAACVGDTFPALSVRLP